jgi:hypothetical protein
MGAGVADLACRARPRHRPCGRSGAPRHSRNAGSRSLRCQGLERWRRGRARATARNPLERRGEDAAEAGAAFGAHDRLDAGSRRGRARRRRARSRREAGRAHGEGAGPGGETRPSAPRAAARATASAQAARVYRSVAAANAAIARKEGGFTLDLSVSDPEVLAR